MQTRVGEEAAGAQIDQTDSALCGLGRVTESVRVFISSFKKNEDILWVVFL